MKNEPIYKSIDMYIAKTMHVRAVGYVKYLYYELNNLTKILRYLKNDTHISKENFENIYSQISEIIMKATAVLEDYYDQLCTMQEKIDEILTKIWVVMNDKEYNLFQLCYKYETVCFKESLSRNMQSVYDEDTEEFFGAFTACILKDKHLISSLLETSLRNVDYPYPFFIDELFKEEDSSIYGLIKNGKDIINTILDCQE